MTEERRQFLPKQLAFLRAQDPNVLYSGSVRAGKTYALCTKAMLRASLFGSREAIVRKHRVTLRATTLVTLLDGDGLNPPVLPRGTYEHNKTDGTIKLRGGGEIVYFGLDDPAKVGSRSLTGCGVDEAAELTEQDWDMIQTRVSVDVPGLARQVYGACNPGPPLHFLARRFGLAAGFQPMPGHVAYRTRSSDNWFLPADYMARINALTGVAHRRLVLGEWVGSEGLVYDNWSRDVHVRQREGPWADVRIAADYGFSNPFAAVLLCLDGDGRVHVARMSYGSGLRVSQMVERCRAMAEGYDCDRAVVDPSASELRAALREAGFATGPGENDVAAGIAVVRERLGVAGDGLPRLTVDPSCEDLIREFETYEYERDASGTQRDRPKKENDHALDALRYGCMAVRSLGRKIVH